MKVVIDGRMILPQMTGVGRYLTGLAGALGRLKGDERYEIWLQEGLPGDHPIWKTQTERLALRPIAARHFDLRAQWIVPNEMRRVKHDLLHFPHFDLPWMTIGEFVVTIHDLKYLARPDFFPQFGQYKRQALRAMISYACRRARCIITDSKYTAHDLGNLLRVDPEKVKVIPLGVEQRFFTRHDLAQKIDFIQRYHLQTPYVLFVGERRLHKNLPSTLQAFATFRKMTHENYQLVIAGKAYADYRLPEETAQSLGISEVVRFLDYVADEDLPLLYSQASALVLLSHYEGFGLPTLEAMASGTPVVASQVTALPEVLGEAGLMTPPDAVEAAAEALKKATSEEDDRQELIARGMERARQFTWENCARQTVEVYHKAAGK